MIPGLTPCDIQYRTYHYEGDHHQQENCSAMLLSVFLAFFLGGFAASSQINEIQTAGKRANLIRYKSGKFVFHLLMNVLKFLDLVSRNKRPHSLLAVIKSKTLWLRSCFIHIFLI